jgi:transcription elongation factor Elf1
MPKAEAVYFNCPNCGALYDLVRVEAEPVMINHELACLLCGAPLQGREGRFVLKYFLLEPSRVARKRRVG